MQSSASFNGIVTFNSNCIIKRAPGATLTAAGSGVNDLVCNGTCSAPSIITVQDDNMYGEQIGTNCAYIDTAVAFLDEVRGVNVTGMNIRYAGTGIEISSECADSQTFKDSTLESCSTGIYAINSTVTLQNSAVSCVSTPTSAGTCASFSGSWGSTCNQVSFHGAAVAGMQALAQSHSPSTGLQLYTYSGNYPTNWPTNYNTSCWIYGVTGLTSICVSNSSQLWNQVGSVLITSKHILTAAHIGFGSGDVFRFIGKSGTHYVGIV